MASLYPAQLASKTKKGKIEAGFDADLIIFNNHTKPWQPYCRGII
jgi:N-acetylglucosamine-6-phosphate deacetylase